MTSAVRRFERNRIEDASASLLDAIAEGMHSMAQPLTVLQAILEVAAGGASSTASYRAAIKRALAEVSRVVDSLDLVQALTTIGRDGTPVSAIDVRSTLDMVRDDLECVLQDTGLHINVEVREQPPIVLASPAKLRQCLFYLVQQAMRGASHGDSIDVCVKAKGVIQVTIGHRRLDGTNPLSLTQTPGSRLVEPRSVILAEALATSQGGRLQWQPWPQVAQLVLQTAEPSQSTPKMTTNQGLIDTDNSSDVANGVAKS
jgi:hypothetical protein